MIPKCLQNIEELSSTDLVVLCDLWTRVFIAALTGRAGQIQIERADQLVKSAERIADEAVAAFRGIYDDHGPQQTQSPLAYLSERLQADPSYAWSWHCNLAMMASDAGADRSKANHHAADFMRRMFGVDPRLNENWKTLGIDDH